LTANQLSVVDPHRDPQWEDLRIRAGGGTIFEHPRWLQLLHDQYGYEMSAWCLADDTGRMSAGMPVALISSRLTGRRLVSLPFSDTCTPLIAPEARVGLDEFATAIGEQSRRLGLDLQVRADLRGAASAHVGASFVQHRLPLDPDLDLVRRRAKSQIRRGVAKARREGVIVERRTDRAGLERFYRLHVKTRRHQGVPTQPRRFILRFGGLFEAGLGFVLIARHGGRDAAAAVFLTAGGTLTYKYGASDRRLLSVRPNNLLFMDAIQWGCQNGQRVLDFGRTDLANEGLRAFKAGWGAKESPLRYTLFAPHAPVPGSSRVDKALRPVIQRAPAVVGRWIGEALYRHVG